MGSELMDRAKKKKLEQRGWTVGDAAEFLQLSETELRLVEMKLSLSARLRKAREKKRLTQAELADRMGSSQSRVAKMEAGDPSVSLDLLVQGLLATGASKREIASALAGKRTAA
jgi:ribosome-binding protein aMBF1 (putative translation factor)